MLPKVANQLAHHTARAAAAAQSSSGHTIRNVLQLQSSAGPSSSGSLTAWSGVGSSSYGGSTGAGAGGAKYHAGSRFYNGYTGAGRAVTQANSAGAGQDDSDELAFHRISLRSAGKTRARSTSLSLRSDTRTDPRTKLGVLKTVQIHVRSRHAFAESQALVQSDSTDVVPAAPARARRNSTVSVSAAADARDLPPDAPPPPVRDEHRDAVDPAAPQTVAPPRPPRQVFNATAESAALLDMISSQGPPDPVRVMAAVREMLKTNRPNVEDFNIALQAVRDVRQEGAPLTDLLEIYNELVKRGMAPTFKTYSLLINALTERDSEVHRVVTSLETRMKRRALSGRTEATQLERDQERITQIRAENNFGSAMALFQAVSALYGKRIYVEMYNNLLRSCSFHANVDAAIHVFAHLEKRRDISPTSAIYMHLMTAYSNAGDLEGAKAVFEEFLSASKAGRVYWAERDSHSHYFAMLGDETRSGSARVSQLNVWHRMIEAYFRLGNPADGLKLLEQMLDSPAGEGFGPADVPPPAASTFTVIIAGFCKAGDVPSALSWFRRLLQQESMSAHPYASTSIPHRPDPHAWSTMLDTLAAEGMIDELNELFAVLVASAVRDGIEIRAVDCANLASANVAYLEAHPDVDQAKAIGMLDFVTVHCFDSSRSGGLPLFSSHSRPLASSIASLYVRHGRPDAAVTFLEHYIKYDARLVYHDMSSEMDLDAVHLHAIGLKDLLEDSARAIVSADGKYMPDLTFNDALRLARLCKRVGVKPTMPVAAYYLHAYALAVAEGSLPEMANGDWDILVHCTDLVYAPNSSAVRPAGFAFTGPSAILRDMAKVSIDPAELDQAPLGRLLDSISTQEGPDALTTLLTELGSSYEALLSQPQEAAPAAEDTSAPVEPTPKVQVDIYHSRFVDEFFPNNPHVTPLNAYSRFEAGVQAGIYPTPEAMGRLINALGRLGELDKVRALYQAAQLVLTSLAKESSWQSVGWFQIEDQMIVALAHAGDFDGAHLHRTRIIEQGGTPSADAYGALIECVRDTTDDAANALTLFQEAQMRGCAPNVFLYNTIISKLAKARKADFALELFQQMKAGGCAPSSITYGAVIAACCRIGDAHSAELLFKEMTSQRNFKPRIPPFNTMMQLYTHTKPDRERALHYYREMVRMRIKPSGHTFKLLIDAYGTIEPVDVPAMEKVFARLRDDRSVVPQGTHWAALINAYGCVQKDLDKAIATFESIQSDQAAVHARPSLPDAVVYEALINVLVTLRRTDLIPQYTKRLMKSKIHMTAYIANFLIKGHAAAGNLDEARRVFEGLVDPPLGVAAPNNHVPHGAVVPQNVPADAPVYREPSTWEAMVRAELGSGNRDRAVALLERLQARQYPAAVYNRISGIMLDDSVSPWPSPTSSSSSQRSV